MKKLDLTGCKFGDLTALRPAPNNHGDKKSYWECACSCGRHVVCSVGNLRSGGSESCGCSRGQRHNGKGTRLYRIWKNIKTRCTNPRVKCYRWYGAKGVVISHLWENDFAAFREWSVKNGYQEDLTIDRKDGDLGYTPENCQWIPFQDNRTKALAKGRETMRAQTMPSIG